MTENIGRIPVENGVVEISGAPSEDVDAKNTIVFSGQFHSILDTVNTFHESIPTYNRRYASYIEEQIQVPAAEAEKADIIFLSNKHKGGEINGNFSAAVRL